MAKVRKEHPEPTGGWIKLDDGGSLHVYDEPGPEGKMRRVWERVMSNGDIKTEKTSLSAMNYGQVVFQDERTKLHAGHDVNAAKKLTRGPTIGRTKAPDFARPMLGPDFQGESMQEFNEYVSANRLYVPTQAEARNKLPARPNRLPPHPADHPVQGKFTPLTDEDLGDLASAPVGIPVTYSGQEEES